MRYARLRHSANPQRMQHRLQVKGDGAHTLAVPAGKPEKQRRRRKVREGCQTESVEDTLSSQARAS